ncbi:unnamed protein product [Adineta ricciae]|nr:unnamed protein product [Adineta ricciae]
MDDDDDDDDDSYDHDDDDDDDYASIRHRYDRTTRKTSTLSIPNKIDQIQKKLKESLTNIAHTFQQGICADMILNETVRERYISKTLTGRVQPVGTFDTTQMAVEYLYGLLCAIPNLPERTNLYKTVDILELTYDPKFYRTSAKFQVNLTSNKTLIFFAIIAFDENFKLCGYEAVIQNVGLTLDFPIEQRTSIINNICQLVQVICPVGSSNHQYANLIDCLSFLNESQTPFGTFDRADQNNVVCRLNHIQLASISPDIHCLHVGKTGGGACVNKTSESYFQGTSDFTTCAYQFRK